MRKAQGDLVSLARVFDSRFYLLHTWAAWLLGNLSKLYFPLFHQTRCSIELAYRRGQWSGFEDQATVCRCATVLCALHLINQIPPTQVSDPEFLLVPALYTKPLPQDFWNARITLIWWELLYGATLEVWAGQRIVHTHRPIPTRLLVGLNSTIGSSELSKDARRNLLRYPSYA